MKRRSLTLLDAIRDRRLFGCLPCFRDLRSWTAWLTVGLALYGLPLSDEQFKIFARLSGRSDYRPPEGGWRTLGLAVGRQAGKSRFSATVAAFESVRASDSRGLYSVILAQDRAAAQRALFTYLTEPFEADSGSVLAGEVIGRTVDTVSLRNGATAAVYPSRPASVRGIRARCVLLDEIDHVGTEAGADVGRALLTASRPCLATVEGSKLIALSSPGRVGSAFHRLITDYHGTDDRHVLTIRGSAPDFNPTLSADYLKSMEGDADAFATEVLGQWVESERSLYDASSLSACVVPGRREIEPAVCRGRLAAFADPASGSRTGDHFSLAVGFRDEAGRAVVAALRRWVPPFSASVVVAECAELLKRYGLREVKADAYAGGVFESLFKAEGISLERAGKTASDLYLDAASVFGSGTVELPDPACGDLAADLLADLRSIVRKSGGERDRAEAPRASGRGHSDLGNAVAGLISVLPQKRRPSPRVGPILVPIRVTPWAGNMNETRPELGGMDDDMDPWGQ